jgi:hypothetical protein
MNVSVAMRCTEDGRKCSTKADLQISSSSQQVEAKQRKHPKLPQIQGFFVTCKFVGL